MSLPALVPELITNNAFAVLTTLFADGRPHSHMMWIDADDECLLINTETGRLRSPGRRFSGGGTEISQLP